MRNKTHYDDVLYLYYSELERCHWNMSSIYFIFDKIISAVFPFTNKPCQTLGCCMMISPYSARAPPRCPRSSVWSGMISSPTFPRHFPPCETLSVTTTWAWSVLTSTKWRLTGSSSQPAVSTSTPSCGATNTPTRSSAWTGWARRSWRVSWTTSTRERSRSTRSSWTGSWQWRTGSNSPDWRTSQTATNWRKPSQRVKRRDL